jgi:hypothetical protein
MDDASDKFALVVLRADQVRVHHKLPSMNMRSGLQVVTSMSAIASCIPALAR